MTRYYKYQAAIGSLPYATIKARLDLSSAVGVLSQFMSNPRQEHWLGIKKIFRYIKGTLDYGLKFEASSDKEFKLSEYADTNWAGDVTSRKSTTRIVFQLGNAMISWKSKR